MGDVRLLIVCVFFSFFCFSFFFVGNKQEKGKERERKRQIIIKNEKKIFYFFYFFLFSENIHKKHHKKHKKDGAEKHNQNKKKRGHVKNKFHLPTPYQSATWTDSVRRRCCDGWGFHRDEFMITTASRILAKYNIPVEFSIQKIYDVDNEDVGNHRQYDGDGITGATAPMVSSFSKRTRGLVIYGGVRVA
jgi:hypothetical protein